MQRCAKCNLPSTYETIEFDQHGVCNICNDAVYKHNSIDWASRFELLTQIVDKHRGRSEYDCIIPFSGGKDSSFQLYYVIEELGLKPLVVRFNHLFYRAETEANIARLQKKLSFDMIDFKPSFKVVKAVMRESFFRKTDFCWHCHTGIYAFPIRIAVKYRIPLVIWGETQSEITSYFSYSEGEPEFEDEAKFNLLRTLGIKASEMTKMIAGDIDVDQRDLLPFTYPSFEEIRELGLCSIPLGSFIPWDYTAQTDIIKSRFSWSPGVVEGVPKFLNPNGEKMECYLQGVRDYLKYLKRGYSRISQIAAFNVRSDRMSPEEAARLVENYDGRRPASLGKFLEFMGMSEDEFNELAKRDSIPPANVDPSIIPMADVDELDDIDEWYKYK